jgi:hypothetical protein
MATIIGLQNFRFWNGGRFDDLSKKNKECMFEQWDLYKEKNIEMFHETFTSYWQYE